MNLLDTGLIVPYVFDLELSGKCNTVCTFCPREEMKRGEQFMTPENFEHVLRNLKEYATFLEGRNLVLPHERVSFVAEARERSPLRVLLCGMGESLINPRQSVEWVGRIRKEVGGAPQHRHQWTDAQGQNRRGAGGGGGHRSLRECAGDRPGKLYAICPARLGPRSGEHRAGTCLRLLRPGADQYPPFPMMPRSLADQNCAAGVLEGQRDHGRVHYSLPQSRRVSCRRNIDGQAWEFFQPLLRDHCPPQFHRVGRADSVVLPRPARRERAGARGPAVVPGHRPHQDADHGEGTDISDLRELQRLRAAAAGTGGPDCGQARLSKEIASALPVGSR